MCNNSPAESTSPKYGNALIKKNISLNRYKQIVSTLRFDKRSDRDKSDKISPVRHLFEDFIRNCRRNYVPSEQVTIDEQLVTFRGRCSFRMYIPSKPGKCWIKIWTLCDAKNAYIFNWKVYCGKENGIQGFNQGVNVVKYLSMPLLKSGRNITMDNFLLPFH